MSARGKTQKEQTGEEYLQEWHVLMARR